MGRKKKSFQDLQDLQVYLSSAKSRMVMIYSRNSIDYPGVVESLLLHSSNSGKKLKLLHDFEAYGLDWMGDLSDRIEYKLLSLDELFQIIDIDMRDYSTKVLTFKDMYSTEDIGANDGTYRNGWNDFCKDYKDGKLFIEGLEVI